MNDKILLAIIASAAGIISAFKLPEIIKNFQDMYALKNKALLRKNAYQKRKLIEQEESLKKYEQLKYKIPLIVDFIKIKNPNEVDTWKLLDMLQNDYTNITSAPDEKLINDILLNDDNDNDNLTENQNEQR